jgi:hypothetical protein
MAHAFLSDYSYKRLKLTQLLAQLGEISHLSKALRRRHAHHADQEPDRGHGEGSAPPDPVREQRR